MDPESGGQAERVTKMLFKAAPTRDLAGLDQFDGKIDVAARKPLRTQLHKFEALGWKSAPPSAETVKRRLIAKAESELFLDRSSSDIDRNVDATCFTQSEYFNYDFSQHDFDPDRRPRNLRRTASAGRSRATDGVVSNGVVQDRREARPGAPHHRTSADYEDCFADLLCELEPDEFGAHAGGGGY